MTQRPMCIRCPGGLWVFSNFRSYKPCGTATDTMQTRVRSRNDVIKVRDRRGPCSL